MEQIGFDVSAKTARLIGRENISGVNGAVLELVKNAYDADATACIIIFDMPFPSIVREIPSDLVDRILSDEEMTVFRKCYVLENGNYHLNDGFSESDSAILWDILSAHNKIIIADNGIGMTEDILKNSWMNIGTSDKEIRFSTEKGRIKTGAKGIGRFALDKLSKKSVVFTKNNNDDLFKWELDWTAFDRAKSLNEINAELSRLNGGLKQVLPDIVPSNLKHLFERWPFDTGTIIVLTPTREFWPRRSFTALNSNLTGLNPFDQKDTFDVLIRNLYFHEYDFDPENLRINKSDYDYFVQVDFDGLDSLKVDIERNEIDVSLNTVTFKGKMHGKPLSLSLEEYWNREGVRCTRDDYSSPQPICYKASDIIKNEPLSEIRQVGPFHLRFYFFKVADGGIEIAKAVNAKRRKMLSHDFSGIKIYRDHFKVRPYGERDSDFYDWLGLGDRSQKSPAPVVHKTGAWRVEPYQVSGYLEIGRRENPFIRDMANREGIERNNTYHILRDLILFAVAKFESDRQSFMREYDLMREEEEKKAFPRVERVIGSIEKEQEELAKTSKRQNQKETDNEKDSYTKEDYKDAAKTLLGRNKSQDETNKILMLLSSMGMSTNTFAHEIADLRKSFATGPSQIKLTIENIIPEAEYDGDPDFDPYIAIEKLQKTDDLLSDWISILMKAVKKGSLDSKVMDLRKATIDNANLWNPILEKNSIVIEVLNPDAPPVMHDFSLAELYIILNNFILNSRSFIEGGKERRIYIDVHEKADQVVIQLENTGEKLSERYKDNPYQIFELGVSQKETSDRNGGFVREGTGIGLWMVRTVAKNHGGDVFFHELRKGTFGFSIRLPK